MIPHPAGLKIEALESRYKEIHNENLPTDWLYIIKEYSLLSVEELVGGMFVYPPEVFIAFLFLNIRGKLLCLEKE